jgi:hypothetical protein
MNASLKQVIIYGTFLTAIVGCGQNKTPPATLGANSSAHTWIYLGGLTQEMDSPEETHNKKILDQIGKKLNIKILAIPYFDRCEKANYKLCWLHYTHAQTLETYDKILKVVEGEKISGFIGFSNGGFFLNQLAQLRDLKHPIISIGAAGTLGSPSCTNTLTMIVGKSEVIYPVAKKFFEDGKNSSLSLTFISHEGGHIFPPQTVEVALTQYAKSKL